MSTKAMKLLLSALGEEASKTLDRPAEPRQVMQEFCRAMTVRTGRPIQLMFRIFPSDILVSGMRLDCGDRSIIIVEEATAPEDQLVILGHELWHEEEGDSGHHVNGLPTAARALTPAQPSEAVRRAGEQVLHSHEVPREAVLTVAARAESADEHEVDAETFGLLFGREVRSWVKGRYAQGPVSADTVEGRIHLSLLDRGGRIL
ncbi:toxin [Streptomyces sp. ISL-22]|uniref:toxin n=1 Tax=unclassified Streptomyces TaxID=2593676 RepID=UPI001BEBF87A|nr:MULTISPECIES: toxin [unclassified Streptomyces]MBT2421917.1 toxin [Streptomyces sp. ISL-24]MBT2433467.1 toxin [Streptomyces sp. ISL-22]